MALKRRTLAALALLVAVLLAVALSRRQQAAHMPGNDASRGTPRPGAIATSSTHPSSTGSTSTPSSVPPGRTTIIGRTFGVQRSCDLQVFVDGSLLTHDGDEFGTIVDEGIHLVELRDSERVVAEWERTLSAGEEWDLGEIGAPVRQVSFRGPPGMDLWLRIGSEEAEPRSFTFRDEQIVTIDCHRSYAIASDPGGRTMSALILLPPPDDIVEIQLQQSAHFRCRSPDPETLVRLRSRAATGLALSPGDSGVFDVPAGAYEIEVYPTWGGTSAAVEPRLQVPPLQLAPGQTLECDESVFADLGAVEIALVADRVVEVAYFWIGEADLDAAPEVVRAMIRRGDQVMDDPTVPRTTMLRIGLDQNLRHFDFDRVPWSSATVCAGIRRWQGEPDIADDSIELKCVPVRRADVRDSGKVELRFTR